MPAGRVEALPALPLPELGATPLALPLLPLPAADEEPPELPLVAEPVDPAPPEPDPVVPDARLFTELLAWSQHWVDEPDAPGDVVEPLPPAWAMAKPTLAASNAADKSILLM